MRKARVLLWITVAPLVASLLGGCVAAVVGGAATGVVVSEDRRTVGTVTEDQGIEIKAVNRITDKYKDAHINATSFNRMVLVTGEVPDAAAKAAVEKIVQAIEKVTAEGPRTPDMGGSAGTVDVGRAIEQALAG